MWTKIKGPLACDSAEVTVARKENSDVQGSAFGNKPFEYRESSNVSANPSVAVLRVSIAWSILVVFCGASVNQLHQMQRPA
jgi:hypothetical protein